MGAKAKQKSTGERASRRTNRSNSKNEDVQRKKTDNEENEVEDEKNQVEDEENHVEDEEMNSPENPEQDDQDQEQDDQDSIPTSGHSILQESLENSDKFLKMFSAHLAKGEFDLEETLPVLTKDEQTSMWDQVYTFFQPSLQAVLQKEETQQPDLVLAVSTLCKLCLDLEVVYESPPMGLKRVVNLQCKHLLDLQKLEHKGVEVVARCLETWYNNKMEERDEIAKPLLRYLIGRALGSKGAKADVKRIWNLHQVLLSLRLDEGGRKDILLQCVGHPLFLSTPEGVKFNVFLFSLSVPFIQDIHKKARTVLPTLTGKQSYSLGEVYQKAWGNSGGEFLSSIEDCIQNIMGSGILVQRGKNMPLARNIIKFLSYFHEQKRSIKVQNMLANLYAPILWRYLKANNHTVRLNATELFLSAYPIEDSTQDICVKSAFLEQQHTQIIQLLKDNVVEVRVAAVLGVGRLLSVYWLMFPSETLRNVVEHMVRELSVDSDYRVRVAVFQSFKSMLGESHSHVYLKEVLPLLKRSLHDVNETVRIAFVDLLLHVCKIKTIKFWDICDLSNLLARVEIDRPVVTRGIVKLLLPSFFSKDLEVSQKLSRCIQMIKENGSAARNFYMILIQFSDIKSLVELMIGILNSIRSFLKSKSAQDESELNNSGVEKNKKRKLYSSSSRLDESQDGNSSTVSSTCSSSVVSGTSESTTIRSRVGSSTQEEDHPYSQISTVGCLLDIVCILWFKLGIPLYKEENIELRSILDSRVSKCILVLFKHYRDTPISNTVVYLASFLTSSSTAVIGSYCLSQLKKSTNFEIHVESLCNWRRGDEVLELLKEWMRDGLSKTGPVEQSGVRFREPNTEEPKVRKAILVINHLLRTTLTWKILLAKNEVQLVDFLNEISGIKLTIQENLGFSDLSVERESELLDIFTIYLKLQLTVGLHKQDVIERLEDTIGWSDHQLVPVIVREIETNQASISFAEKTIAEIIRTITAVLRTGLVDEEFINHVVDFVNRVVTKLSLADLILDLLYECSAFAYTSDLTKLYEERVPVEFVKFLQVFNNQGWKLEEKEMAPIESAINKFYRLYHQYSTVSEEDQETFIDLTETVIRVTVLAISSEIGRRGVECVVQVCESVEEGREVKGMLGMVVETLVNLIKKNINLDKMLILILEDKTDLQEVTNMDIISVLCCSAYINTPSLRSSVVERVKQFVEALPRIQTENVSESEELMTILRKLSICNSAE